MTRVFAGLVRLSIVSVAFGPALAAPRSLVRIDRTLAPPHALDGLRAGLPVDAARDALATYRADADYHDAAERTRLVRDAGDGARYYVLVQAGVISRIGIEAPRALVDRMVGALGKPASATNAANEAIQSWSAPSWRIDVACRGPLCRLAFHTPLAASFFGPHVAPPGPIAGLRPWTRRGDFSAPPVLTRGTELPAGPEDVRVAVDFARDGRLRSVLIGGLPANARSVIEQAWGAPAGDTWWNPDGGWRAQLDDGLHALQLFPYVPAARLLGPGAGIAAFPQPILGASRDRIEKAYAGGITLPPIEDGTGPTTVAIGYGADGHANRLEIQLPFGSMARRDELVRVLEAKWGAATKAAQTYMFPTTTVHIEARETASVLVLTLRL